MERKNSLTSWDGQMRNRVVLLGCTIAFVICSGLQAAALTPSSVTLTWTAPGNDGQTGQASTYDIRYSLAPISDANWAGATKVTGIPTPKSAGNREVLKITGLLAATTYYFCLKTADARPNWSLLSNVAFKTTCPSGCNGQNGNVNGSVDGRVDLADLAVLVTYVSGSSTLYTLCPDMANINQSADGVIDVGDLAALVAYLTGGTPVTPCH
jgi:hypothetical protein